MPVLSFAQPVAPGASATLPFGLRAEDGLPAHVSIAASDLVGPDGHRVPASAMVFDPQPLAVAPGQTSRGLASITVPPGTAPGRYTGVFRATELEDLVSVVMLDVL
jgi:hypothetical protein